MFGKTFFITVAIIIAVVALLVSAFSVSLVSEAPTTVNVTPLPSASASAVPSLVVVTATPSAAVSRPGSLRTNPTVTVAPSGVR